MSLTSMCRLIHGLGNVMNPLSRVISLYLGRIPTICVTKLSPSQDFCSSHSISRSYSSELKRVFHFLIGDDSDDHLPWQPCYVTETNNDTLSTSYQRPRTHLYQPMPSYSLTTFRAMINLFQILEPILLWSNGDSDLPIEGMEALKDRLQVWR